MSNSRRYLLPLLLLAPLNILCAKLLLTPQTNDILQNSKLTNRGWPWPFYELVHQPAVPGFDLSLFRWHILAADLAILGGLIALCAALIVWHMRRHHGRFQISLRALLFVVTMAAIGFGWWFGQRNYSKLEARFFANADNIFQIDGTTPGPAWLKWLTGNYQLFDRVNAVRFVGDRRTVEKTNLLLPRLAELSAIRRISIAGFDSEWGHLRVAAQFEELELHGLRFYDDLISELRTLKRLQSIVLCASPDLTDEQLRQLAGLQHLNHLTVPEGTSPETIAWLQERISSVEVCTPVKPIGRVRTWEAYFQLAMSPAMADLLIEKFGLRNQTFGPQPDDQPLEEPAVQ